MRFGSTLVTTCCGVLIAVAPVLADDTAVLLSGESFKANVETITEAGVRFARQADRIALADLRRIDRPIKAETPPLRSYRVYLADGSVLVASRVQADGQHVTVDIAEAGALQLPLASVRGIVLVPVSVDARGRLQPEPAFAAALGKANDPADALFVMREPGQLTVVSGALESLGADDARFVWNDRARTIGRSKLYGVTLATSGDRPDVTGQARVTLVGGSRVWANVRLDEAGQAQLTRDDGVTLDVPWRRVAKLVVRSPKMAFCSDLTPVRIDRAFPLAAPAWGPTFDAAVMSATGDAIRLGGRRYDRGIGVRSATAITYDIARKYDRFVATVGFDDSLAASRTNTRLAPRGEAAFVVMGDGRELLRVAMTDTDKPRPINVDVTGVEELKLYVDPLGSDLGDATAWADARLIRDE